MNNQFINQVAVVTGGSTGIGFSIAHELLNRGAKRVYITGRTESKLNQAVEKLGSKSIALTCDVSVQKDLDKLKHKIESLGDSIDMIFANAGIAENNQFGQTTESDFLRVFDINVKGVFFTVQTLLPLIKEQGAIVLTASIVANKGMPNLSLYNASKAAVRSFARSWANDLKEKKIRVNALSPGFTDTPIMENGLKMSSEQKEALKQYANSHVPLGYMATPDEISKAALYLASSEASYINGIELTTDGGFSQI